jgi:RNA polymerase sigma-70 factor (ECF subfamily)
VHDDAALVLAAQQDPREFEPLYSKYYEPILRFVYKRLDTKSEAYDVTSQVFLSALQNLSKYEDRGFPFSSWLYRIAINELNQFFRKKQPLPSRRHSIR